MDVGGGVEVEPGLVFVCNMYIGDGCTVRFRLIWHDGGGKGEDKVGWCSIHRIGTV